MIKEFNRLRHKRETLYKAEHVRVVGFWVFVDSHAEQGDSRLYEWSAKMETIPQTVVERWAKEGFDYETMLPRIITDPNPVFAPLMPDSGSWTSHRTVLSS